MKPRFAVVLIALGVVAGCGKYNVLSPTTTLPTPPLAPLVCDDSLWQPTYSKDRLIILNPCEHETGEVMFRELEYDGDLVIDIKPPTTRLLKPGNVNVDGGKCVVNDPKDILYWPYGCLHVEIPCQGEINVNMQPDAAGACIGFTGGKITIPEIGDIIEVAGHWVTDSRHGSWAEIHGAVTRLLSH